ncbi:MAG: twitching motility protein PilT [Solirubrobacteraceae bacterium]|jgi:hypothetical protein
MARGLTLDSGALIAADKNSRRFWALWHRRVDRKTLVTVPAPALAQVWRGNSPMISRVVNTCTVEVLDEAAAKRVGELLAASRTSDTVDAAVVAGAVERGDAIVTSDPDDIRRLVDAAGGAARGVIVIPL